MTKNRSLDRRISEKVSVTSAIIGLVLVGFYAFDLVRSEVVLLVGLGIVCAATGTEHLLRRIRGDN